MLLAGIFAALIAFLGSGGRIPDLGLDTHFLDGQPWKALGYYPNCDAARAAGVAPIHRGEPGYRPELDADDDGVACEPYRGF